MTTVKLLTGEWQLVRARYLLVTISFFAFAASAERPNARRHAQGGQAGGHQSGSQQLPLGRRHRSAPASVRPGLSDPSGGDGSGTPLSDQDTNSRVAQLVEQIYRKEGSPQTGDLKEAREAIRATTPLLVEVFKLIPGATTEEKEANLKALLKSNRSAAGMDEFLALIPGKERADKLAYLNRVLGGENAPLSEKMQILTHLLRAIPKSQGMAQKERADLFRALEKYVRVARAMAGTDGRFNGADIIPVINAVVSPEEVRKQVETLIRTSGMIKSKWVRDLALELYRKDTNGVQDTVYQTALSKAQAAAVPKFQEFLRQWQVETVDHREERTPDQKKALSLDRLLELGPSGINVPGLIARAARTRKMPEMPAAPSSPMDSVQLSRNIIFPQGIPIRDLADFIETGRLPPSLRFRYRAFDQKVIVTTE